MNRELLDIYSDYVTSQNQYASATGLAALLKNDDWGVTGIGSYRIR